MAVNMLAQIAFPTVALALTSGPSQPEFSSFEPVATTNMVNDFSGDFVYNIPIVEVPGANGAGYPLTLSYHGGTTPEEESSWVGYGWTMNPGAINRNKKGYPDDWNGQTVTTFNQTPSNKTATVGGSVNAEFFSGDLGFGLSGSLRFNNFKGFGYTTGFGLSFDDGSVSLGYHIADGDGSFSFAVSPAGLLTEPKEKAKTGEKTTEGSGSKVKTKLKVQGPTLVGTLDKLPGSSYGYLTRNSAERPSAVTGFSGDDYKLDIAVCGTPYILQIGGSFDAWGSYTVQTNWPAINNSSYGYMYSENATNGLMDYHLEKATPYKKRDVFLGVPINDADDYGVTGEGLSGGFRMFTHKVGNYQPNNVTSITRHWSVGVEVELGMDFGGGIDIPIGWQKLEQEAWNGDLTFTSEGSNDYDEPVFCRFNNDLGGYVQYGTSDQITRGGLSSDEMILDKNQRSGRSSYIGYNTIAKMQDYFVYGSDSIHYRSFSKDTVLNKFIDRSESCLQSQIGEYSIVNEDGLRYSYSLPVFSRNDKNLAYGIPSSLAWNDNSYLVYHNVTGSQTSIVGETYNSPYATTYLLTEITSPDYIDRTNNGPSDDDFGGYTRFAYNKEYGSKLKTGTDSTWYKWRIPYNGLLYQKSDISNPTDDLGTVSEGEKEIYYLDSIITKTHVAVFETSDRSDAIGAVHNREKASATQTKGTQHLKKLDRIKLFARNGNQLKLIKIINFSYDYSLCKGVINQDYPQTSGKLTLKKVWFEYEGIYNSKISPYEFDYRYPETEYPSEYSSLNVDTLVTGGDTLKQNPDYNKYNIDAWGNYQFSGKERYDSMKTWIDQTPALNFDPGAWQLKNIILPSGGEIHVQYEQDDYCYVQNRDAHVMASLTVVDDNMYYLNCSEMGVYTLAEKQELVNKINEIYANQAKRIYFKFLYKLVGNTPPTLIESKCNNEYITGYVYIQSAAIDGSNNVYIELPNNPDDKYLLPEKVCKDFVHKERAGLLTTIGDCGCNVNVFSDDNPIHVVDRLTNYLFNLDLSYSTCNTMNPALSYFRVPIVKDKKGGGIRVKRIMLYDNGIESGNSSLYGSEYTYKFYDTNRKRWRSSGVATNEPSTIREENVLVEAIERNHQTWLDKILSGTDKKQTEGPLGESLLPSPSVGYSRVVVSNIHSGVTSPGYTVKEFLTAYDKPFECEMTEIHEIPLYIPPVPIYNISLYVNDLKSSQGFLFKTNAMHGKPESTSSYAGNYSFEQNVENASGMLVSSEQYTYFEPEEELPVIEKLSDFEKIGNLNDLPKLPLGKESDLVIETRKIKDWNNAISLEMDISVGYTPPAIFLFQLTFAPYINLMKSYLYSHATSRIISYPAVVKSVLSYKDGIYHLTENKAFNKETGKPIIVSTRDGFDKMVSAQFNGTYKSVTIPASLVYENMGQKAANERLYIPTSGHITLKLQQDVNDNFYISVNALDTTIVCKNVSKLAPGDLVLVKKIATPSSALFNILSVSGSRIDLKKVYYSPVPTFVGDDISVEVIRSGHTNQLNAVAGTFTTYGADTVKVDTLMEDVILNRQSLPEFLNQEFANNDTLTANDILAAVPNSTLYGIVSGDTVIVSHNGDTLYFTIKNGAVIKCQDFFYNASSDIGTFVLDTNISQLAYLSSGIWHPQPQYPSCLKFATDSIRTVTFKHVVASGAQIYTNYWPYDTLRYYPYNTFEANDYERGFLGKWRTESIYAYKTPIKSVQTDSLLNYQTGMYDMELFNWKYPSANNSEKWLRTTKTNSYSPDGNALEEQNILGIKSFAKYGYERTLPYIVAKNCNYKYAMFESYENIYGTDILEDGMLIGNGTIDTIISHSGRASLLLNHAGTDTLVIGNVSSALSTDLLKRGISIKAWVRTDASNPDILAGKLKAQVWDAGGSTSYKSITMIRKALVGEWALYEGVIPGSVHTSDVKMVINYSFAGSENIWFDDIRVQPIDAQVVTYVYDVSTHRLVTSFDDQHFGLFYQYNAEGKLVRKLKETERGMKTIQETQYNSTKKNRQ